MAKEVKPCLTPNCSRPRLYGKKLCYQCFRADLKKKKEEKKLKKIDRSRKTKKYQMGQLKIWHDKTWKLMSEIVRRTGADADGFDYCYTCPNRKHWKELQGGHRYHRTLDFDFRNIHKQCSTCNGKQSRGGKSGNLGEYERRLRNEYGHEWCEQLKLDAGTHLGYTLAEVMTIYYDLREKLARL